MWTLGRFLPLAIGDKVHVENKYWKNFIMLLMIMDILFAPTFRRDDCGYLGSLINDHHYLFVLLVIEFININYNWNLYTLLSHFFLYSSSWSIYLSQCCSVIKCMLISFSLTHNL